MTSAYRVEALQREVSEVVGELLAKHEETRDLNDFAKYRGTEGDSLDDRVAKAVRFMRDELGFTPWSKQIEVIEAFLSARRTAVRGFHGAGKDAILAPLMLFAAYVLRMLVIAISATEKQLLGQLWRELGNRFSARLPGELYTADLRIAGQKRIIATTSASTSNLTGWHDRAGVFVAISEAQGEQTEEVAFDAAIANAVDDASRIVVVGNPIKAVGRFYEVSQKATWRAIGISAFDHPNIVQGRVVIAGGPSPTWPAEMAAEYGSSSPWYVARVLGEFPTDGNIDSLIQRAWMHAAFARHESPGFMMGKRGPLHMALDVARTGPDENALAVVRGPVVHQLITWRCPDTTDTENKVVDYSQSLLWPIERNGRGRIATTAAAVIVDEPGIGGSLIDHLRKRLPNVIAYNGANTPQNPKRYLNVRAESYWRFRELLQTGQIALPRDEKLFEEAVAAEWFLSPKGLIQIVAKDDIRAAIGRSPDRLDAVVMGLYETAGKVKAQWGHSLHTL